MKLSAFLSLFLPALALAKCYSGGETVDVVKATEFLDRACKALVKDYAVNEAHWEDYDAGNGQCYKYTLQRISGGDPDTLRSIDMKECKSGMINQIKCSHGGKSYYKNWMYAYVNDLSRTSVKGRLLTMR